VEAGSREENASNRKRPPLRPAAIDPANPVPHLRCTGYNGRDIARETMMQNETRQMPGDAPRDLPRRGDRLSRFLGGSPLSVAFRLILLSILVGVVLAAIGFDPWNIVSSIRLLFQRIWEFGFDAINGLWRYFLLGAVIVIPIWLISRMFGAPRGR
jgi:hypothetical protein